MKGDLGHEASCPYMGPSRPIMGMEGERCIVSIRGAVAPKLGRGRGFNDAWRAQLSFEVIGFNFFVQVGSLNAQ